MLFLDYEIWKCRRQDDWSKFSNFWACNARRWRLTDASQIEKRPYRILAESDARRDSFGRRGRVGFHNFIWYFSIKWLLLRPKSDRFLPLWCTLTHKRNAEATERTSNRVEKRIFEVNYWGSTGSRQKITLTYRLPWAPATVSKKDKSGRFFTLANMVVAVGLEPTTSRMWGARSNQLSYATTRKSFLTPGT